MPDSRLFIHVANENKASDKAALIRARIAKGMGKTAGVADYLLFVPRDKYHGLALELKRAHGGVLSEHQRAWLELVASQGYATSVAAGALEAMRVITAYLKNEHVNQ